MSASLRELGASAWVFRTEVEREAALRFERLAVTVASFDAASPVVAMLTAAAADERRHVGLCAQLATAFGAQVPPQWPSSAPHIAPPELDPRAAALYEIVAACCVTETESFATLTTLLPRTEGDVDRILREIARDEVRHAQLGWAHLGRERERRGVDLAVLPALIPRILAGTIEASLFGPSVEPLGDDEGLYAFGVLPHRVKREVFVRSLTEVVFPGLEHVGVDAGPARAWLEAQTRSA